MEMLKRAIARLRGVPTKYLNAIYYVAFTSILFQQDIFMTRFPRESFEIFYIAGTFLAAIIAGLRWIKYVPSDKAYSLVSVLVFAVGGFYLVIRGSFYFLVLALLTVGAKDAKTLKLLIIYCVLAAVITTANVVYFFHNGGELVKGGLLHFGSVNSTDFQGLLFFILIPYLMIRNEKITVIELFAWLCIELFFWQYMLAENNLYCSLLAIAVSFAYKTYVIGNAQLNNPDLGPNRRSKCGQFISFFPVLSFAIFGIVMILLVANFDPSNERWIQLNELLHKRLQAPHEVYMTYPPRLWGSEYVVVGWGYTPGVDVWAMYSEYGYTYIDSSYPNILIMHGIIPYITIIAGLTFLAYRYRKAKSVYPVLLLTILALDCCAEGHLKELECNPFLVLPFAEVIETHKNYSSGKMIGT